MIRALYSAASSLVAQSTKQDIIANNIANAQTPGFKRERTVSASFAATLDEQLVKVTPFSERPPYPDSLVDPLIVRDEQAADQTEGPIVNTGSKLDFAIDGPGEFEVNDGNGSRYTRNGSFKLGKNNELITQDGANVVGQNGPIRVPQGEWNITSDGSVFANKNLIDRIKIVGGQTGKTQLLQGSIEQSNVNIVREMVDMIANMRSFEANQRVVTNIDQSLSKMINEGGKV